MSVPGKGTTNTVATSAPTWSSGLGGNFPAPPPGNSTGPFSGFVNSPVGQRMTGAGETDAFGGQKPGFFGLMQQQAQYNNSRQASMTPAEKRRHELVSMMANSGQQPASFSPVQFGGPGNGGTLTDFLTAILKQGKGGV